MNNHKALFLMMMFSFSMLSVAFGETSAPQVPTYLTREQWTAQIQTVVTDSQALKTTMAQIASDQQVEFTQQVVNAIKSYPADPQKKAVLFVQAALACIGASTKETRYQVIAEVFACVPIEYLPYVTDVLAERFSQSLNKFSDEAYQQVAQAIIEVAEQRNAKTESPSVRDAFVLAVFLKNPNPQALIDALSAKINDKQTQSVVNTLIVSVIKDGNYDALLTAAGVESLGVSLEEVMQAVGVRTGTRSVEQLQSGANSGGGVMGLIGGAMDTSFGGPAGGEENIFDMGINITPKPHPTEGPTPYQNQRTP